MYKHTSVTLRSVSAFIGVLLLFFFNACSSATFHQTYNYANFSCPSGAPIQLEDDFAIVPLHEVSTLSIQWRPFSGPLSAESTPSSVRLSAELRGPFPSLNVAQQVSHRDVSNSESPVVASTIPIQTNDWTNKTYTSTLALPSHLLPGYYLESEQAESTTANGITHGAEVCILKITF